MGKAGVSADREQILPLPFCCIQAFDKLDEAHLHCGGGRSALLSLSIQVSLIQKHSYRYVLIQPSIWAPCVPVELMHRLLSSSCHVTACSRMEVTSGMLLTSSILQSVLLPLLELSGYLVNEVTCISLMPSLTWRIQHQ